MKYEDNVRVIKDKEKYKNLGITKGMVGYISLHEIRNNTFFVCFIDENFKLHENEPEWFQKHYDEIKDDKLCEIKIQDLELINDNGLTDEEILESLPKHNPKWWCKVEDGYIMNLLGEKKNKIPYDYDS